MSDAKPYSAEEIETTRKYLATPHPAGEMSTDWSKRRWLATVDAAQEALRKYGDHQGLCATYQEGGGEPPCVCGLESALGGEKKP